MFKFVLLLVIFFLFLIKTAIAEQCDYRVVTGYIPPWSMSSNKDYPGSFVEVFEEIQKRLKINCRLEYLPWSRAIKLAQSNEKIIIFPLAKLPQREKLYQWMFAVKKMQMLFVSAQEENLDEETCKLKKRILVHKAAPPEMILKKRGFTNLAPVHDITPRVVDMLLFNRVEAWFTPKDMADWVWKLNPEATQPNYGPPLIENDVYFAASSTMPKSMIDAYRTVFKTMKTDGTIEGILSKYRR